MTGPVLQAKGVFFFSLSFIMIVFCFFLQLKLVCYRQCMSTFIERRKSMMFEKIWRKLIISPSPIGEKKKERSVISTNRLVFPLHFFVGWETFLSSYPIKCVLDLSRLFLIVSSRMRSLIVKRSVSEYRHSLLLCSAWLGPFFAFVSIQTHVHTVTSIVLFFNPGIHHEAAETPASRIGPHILPSIF